VKKTYKHPDGTEEILDGTPEEIAELERLLDRPKRLEKKPEVLKGKNQEWAELLKKLQEIPPNGFTQHLRSSCVMCGKYDCFELHIYCGTPVSESQTGRLLKG